MKKSTLIFLAAGLTASPAFAQYGNNSVVFQQATPTNFVKHIDHGTPVVITKQAGTANKPTAGPHQGWFDYLNPMYISGTSVGYYWETYQDSTARQFNPSSSTYSNVSLYGLGHSFDPTTDAFEGSANDINNIPGWVVGTDKAYELDSVLIEGWYVRRPYNNYTDTLLIETAFTDGTGAFALQFAKSAANANINPLDSIARFATAIYDPANNKMSDSVSATNKRTWKIPLNAAFFADSTGSRHLVQVPLTTPLSVPAGGKLVTWVHFKSGHTYPLNYKLDSMNYWKGFTYEIDGANTYPKQYGKGKDATTVLLATKQSKYGSPYTYNGHNIFIPSLAYNDPTGFGVPGYAYYLKCANCEKAGIGNVTGNMEGVTAYPNPANSEVAIGVAVTKAANVQVSLVNTLGQQVATKDLGKVNPGKTIASFSTGSLPAGIYVYTVNADGQRMTGRVVITH
jgi:hypothetical protein